MRISVYIPSEPSVITLLLQFKHPKSQSVGSTYMYPLLPVLRGPWRCGTIAAAVPHQRERSLPSWEWRAYWQWLGGATQHCTVLINGTNLATLTDTHRLGKGNGMQSAVQPFTRWQRKSDRRRLDIDTTLDRKCRIDIQLSSIRQSLLFGFNWFFIHAFAFYTNFQNWSHFGKLSWNTPQVKTKLSYKSIPWRRKKPGHQQTV